MVFRAIIDIARSIASEDNSPFLVIANRCTGAPTTGMLLLYTNSNDITAHVDFLSQPP